MPLTSASGLLWAITEAEREVEVVRLFAQEKIPDLGADLAVVVKANRIPCWGFSVHYPF